MGHISGIEEMKNTQKGFESEKSEGRDRLADRPQRETAVCSVVAPCSLVQVYQRFRGACCLHNQVGDLPLSA
jgi:hypothetical protein